jgi:hypothetical protein
MGTQDSATNGPFATEPVLRDVVMLLLPLHVDYLLEVLCT